MLSESLVRSYRRITTLRSSLWLVPLLGFGTFGCGNAIYAVQVSSASSRLEEAKELRAEELAPYEYTMALEHLRKARSEAAEADYGDAIVFAEVCEEYSDKAIRISQEAHRSAGR
jgi:hypothetical protein